MHDLLLVVPDKNTHFALRGALARPEALGIRAITYRVQQHPNRDSGVRLTGADIARLQRSQFHHAVLVFDHEGCGASEQSVEAIEAEVERGLEQVWGCAARVVVAFPEMDAWMWGSDNALGEVLRWPAGYGPIRAWLTERGWQFGAEGKPERPKEAIEALLKVSGTPRSSNLYEEIARRLSLRHCSDPAFLRLRETLRAWFPP